MNRDPQSDGIWTDGDVPHWRCQCYIEEHRLVEGEWVCPGDEVVS